MSTIGIIGAGHIGSQVAYAAIGAGYDVVIANSRGPETLGSLVADLGPRARAATAEEAAAAGDFALVAVPLRAYADVPVDDLAGKVVLDANNYYPQRDGEIAALEDESTTTSELLQAHLPASRVVKAFNHIYSSQITSAATAAGTPGRRALAVFGDDADARGFAARFLDELGFDAVDGGPLAESWRIQRDTPGYGAELDAAGLRAALAAAVRPGHTG